MRCFFLLAVIFATTLHASLAFVEVCSRTTVDVAATQCVETTPDYLCVTDTCERYKCHYVWTCDLPDDPLEIEKCCVRFSFGEPQDLRLLRIKWLDFKNPPTLKVHVDGEYYSDITIVYGTATYHLHADKVSEVTFCGDDNETTGAVSDSMSEVEFFVE